MYLLRESLGNKFVLLSYLFKFSEVAFLLQVYFFIPGINSVIRSFSKPFFQL